MSETSKIQWTEHTGGPFLGCEPVSPGCANCYAWELALTRLEPIFRNAYKKAGFKDWETRPVWGRSATRVLTKGFWSQARSLNAKHARDGTRGRMFPSLIDWLDVMEGGIVDQDGNHLAPVEVLARFLDVVRECRHLDWLLLTKRPESFFPRLNAVLMRMSGACINEFSVASIFWLQQWVLNGVAPSNVWIGVTTEDQERVNLRTPLLLQIPAVVRFLSVEPLLGPVSFMPPPFGEYRAPKNRTGAIVNWVIVGGESGRKARPCHLEWIRGVVAHCQVHRVPVFVKQLGSQARHQGDLADTRALLSMKHKKGGELSEWPKDLQVREYPQLEPIESGVSA